MLGWAIEQNHVKIEWDLDYEKNIESHLFKDNGYYLVSKPFSKKAEKLDVEKYNNLSQAEEKVNELRS